jgi:hypothetical protein
LDDTGKISVGIAKFRAPSIFRHLYNQSAVRLCLVDLTDSRLLRGQPIQPQELVFTTSTPNLSGFSSSHAVFDAGRLFQFSGPVFIVADDDGVGDDVGGLGEKKKLKLVFSARHRSFVSNTVSKTNQRFDSSLFISNLDGTQLEQVGFPLSFIFGNPHHN